jgi:uncharacterized repeat protein (TIGR01451 family)
MKTGKVAGVLACLCLGLLTACQQTRDGNPISSLPGPIIGVQNPNTEPGGTGVGLPSTPPIGSVPTTQPSPLVPPPVSAPTIPPLPSPNPSPSIIGLPPGPLAAPTFTKSFNPASAVGAPVTVTVTFTIVNNSGIQLTGLSFTDSLPAGLLVANPPNLTNTCFGTPSALAGGASIALNGGILAANATCAVTVQVFAGTPGTYVNPPVTLTSAQAPPAQSGTVTLVVGPTSPVFTKAFPGTPFTTGTPVPLTFIITNNNTATPLTGLAFTDILPPGLVIDTPLFFINTCGGVLNVAAGGTSIAFSNGTLPAGTTCTISVNVTSSTAGTYINPPTTLTSNEAAPVIAPPVSVTFV